ncbi:MAG: fimbrillin family protein [Muribaculaceae bacterium]|nr:fimbrillin family protein [Muribaculaceae bacterium]
MKKFLFWTALASVALTGCVKNDVEPNPSLGQDVEITFNAPVVGKITKAPVTGEIGTTYDQAESFIVTAWRHLKSKGDFAPANATVYIDQKPTVYTATATGIDGDAGTGSWHFNPTYYWPKTHYLTFSAYSPASLKEKATITIDETTGIYMDDVEIEDVVTNQYDILYSDRVFDQEESDYARTSNNNYLGVDIKFHHALSSVVVKVKMNADYSSTNNDQITINKIWFDKVYMNADFKENLSLGTETTSTGIWDDFKSENNNMDILGGVVGIDNTTETQYGTTALLIPQVLTGNLNVNYTITNHDDVSIVEEKSFILNTLKDGSSNTISEWEQGKRYTYTLTFGLNEIYLAPQVDNWDDVTMSDINI